MTHEEVQAIYESEVAKVRSIYEFDEEAPCMHIKKLSPTVGGEYCMFGPINPDNPKKPLYVLKDQININEDCLIHPELVADIVKHELAHWVAAKENPGEGHGDLFKKHLIKIGGPMSVDKAHYQQPEQRDWTRASSYGRKFFKRWF